MSLCKACEANSVDGSGNIYCEACHRAMRTCSCGAPKSRKGKMCRGCATTYYRGENHSKWRGGRAHSSEGYVLTYAPGHPAANNSGRVFEHRLVMERHLNRYLTRTENIHHKNGKRDDNRIENLELWSTAQPCGQRVEDKLAWAQQMFSEHASYRDIAALLWNQEFKRLLDPLGLAFTADDVAWFEDVLERQAA